MTNNDEMALELREAAESATKGSWRRTSTEFNGICVGPFSFTKEQVLARAVEKRDAIFISVANPENILALLAERDADKKRIEMLEKYVDERDAQNQDLLLNIGSLQQRIAELEARTVSVKWPDDGMDDCYDLWGAEHCRDNFDCGYNFSAVRHEQAISEALAAAGIKLEVGE
ncbi:ead/Ea22-like family protein [Kosakonia sp. YIM B13605]|uniref:ead/Ea22-like family protein n=1 Tax=unclassified Kosakonia TaxID=2632876 RepID=UPI0036BF450B